MRHILRKKKKEREREREREREGVRERGHLHGVNHEIKTKDKQPAHQPCDLHMN